VFAHIEGEKLAEGVREQGAGKTFGLKRDKVAGEWREIHNEELYDT
jgi:hypothetical protein